MEGVSAQPTFDQSGAGVDYNAQHVAFGSIRYIPTKTTVFNSEDDSPRDSTALRDLAGVTGPKVVLPERRNDAIFRSVHTHDFVSPSADTSRPKDTEVAAAAGWNCSFCLRQRGAEDYAKAYTGLLVSTQQQLCNAAGLRAPVSEQQMHNWQGQQVQHQQSHHQERLPRSLPRLFSQDSRHLQQGAEQVVVEHQIQEEQSPGKDLAGWTDEDLQKTPYAESSSCVPESLSATCTPGYPPSGSVFERIATSIVPVSRAACSGEANETARAYVSHLTFHREDGRSPSPRRIAPGFVARKYAQNLREREERLIQVAVATAGEYTRSLYPAQAARLQCLESGIHISQTQACTKSDPSHTPADAPGDSDSIGRGQACSRSGTGLQQHQPQEWRTQQPEKQHPCESAPTTETVPVISSAVHPSADDRSRPQIVTEWANERGERLPTDADLKNSSDGAAVRVQGPARVVEAEEQKPEARTLDIQCGPTQEHEGKTTLPAPVNRANDVKEASVLKPATDTKQRTRRPLLQCKTCAEHLPRKAQGWEATISARHRSTKAVQKTSDTSKPLGTARSQVDPLPLSMQAWLDEEQKLHLE